MSRPLLSATLIAKNEKDNIVPCLDTIWPYVDEVVVCDTGSTDGTIDELKEYAAIALEDNKLKIVHHEWRDDFGAARQVADDAATGEWLVWADFDDSVHGLDTLREYARNATPDVVAFFCAYSYAQDKDGNTISELWRERVVRNTGVPWADRLHEHKIFTSGTVVKVGPDVALWVHRRNHEVRSGERNLRILERWNEEEPDNARVLHSLALEYMGEQRHKDASDTFARYLEIGGEDTERRAQASRHLCVMLMIQNRVAEAKAAALHALNETWMWADTHLSLAEVAQTVGKPDEGFVHARTALEIGKPDTLLIINPVQYTVHPRALMAVCLAQMGRLEESVKMADEALKLAPSYQLLTEHAPVWRGALKKQHTIDAMLAMVTVLEEAGELVKARALLDMAPWYVTNDARLMYRRSEVSRMIRDRTITPAPLAEDEAADAFVKRHLEAA